MNVGDLLRTAVGLGRSGRWQDAERMFRDVILQEPSQVDAHYQLGRALRVLGKPEEGLKHLTIAAALRPDIAPLMNSLGLAFRELSILQKAADAFHRAGRIAPNYSEAFYHLGRIQGEATSYHRAEDIKMSLAGRIALCPPKEINYTFAGEQGIISELLSQLEGVPKICVDIGASDGVTFSNSFALFRDGWSGAAIEGDPKKLPDLAWALRDVPGHVTCFRSFINPENVNRVLSACEIPADFGFLSLDIDSYDYFVLAALLESYHPWVICTEVSIEVPPPVRLALRYEPKFSKKPKIAGQSIAILESLLRSKGYSLVALEYNNAFAVRNDLLAILSPKWKPLTAKEAWQVGYVNRPDRGLKFPWLRKFEHLIDASAEQAFDAFRNAIEGQEEMYVLDYSSEIPLSFQ